MSLNALVGVLAMVGVAGCGYQGAVDITDITDTGVANQAIVRGGAPCHDDVSAATVALLLERHGVVSFSCTGTLVAPDTVLTAAHCIVRNEPGLSVSLLSDVRAWYGGSNPGLPPGAVRAMVAIANPAFDGQFNSRFSDAESFDVGLLLLEHAISSVAPMRLPSAAELATLVDGDTVEIVGFGLDDDGQAGLKRCAFTHVTGQGPALLAVGDGQRLPSLCNGDSGGPTVAFVGPNGAPRLAGVASFGTTGCGQAAFAVKTSPHIGFMEAEMQRWCDFGLRSDDMCRSPGLPGAISDDDPPPGGCASTPPSTTGRLLALVALLGLRWRNRRSRADATPVHVPGPTSTHPRLRHSAGWATEGGCCFGHAGQQVIGRDRRQRAFLPEAGADDVEVADGNDRDGVGVDQAFGRGLHGGHIDLQGFVDEALDAFGVDAGGHDVGPEPDEGAATAEP